MPRAVDFKQLEATNDPNRSGTEFHLAGFQDIDKIIQEIIDGLPQAIETLLFPIIEEFTGIDLSAIKPLIEAIHLDLSSPEAFFTSLVNAITALPGILIALLTSLIGQLIQSGNSDQLMNLLGGLLAGLKGLTGIDLTQFLSVFSGLDTSSPEAFIGSLITLIQGAIQGFLDIFWQPTVGFGQVGDFLQNLLPNGSFDTANSIDGFNVWNWVGDVLHGLTGGSAMVLGNGALREMVSDPATPVAPGQKLDISQWIKWTGVNASGPAFQLKLNTYSDKQGLASVSELPVAAITNPAVASSNSSEGDFVRLSGSYTVPDTGVGSVRVHLVQTDNVLSGKSWWSDGSVTASQKMSPDFVQGLVEKLLHLDLNGLFDAAGLKNMANIPEIAQEKITGLIDYFKQLIGSISGIFDGTQDLDDVVNRLVGIFTSGFVNASFLDNVVNIPTIPNTKVEGVGTGANIGETMQSTWDFLWSGFTLLTGSSKTPAELANAASATTALSQAASDLGQENNAILAVRNNQPLYVGVDETSESTFPIGELGGATDPLNFAVTQSTAPMGYIRISQASTKGFVSWFGKGFSSITAMYVDVYDVNTTTGVHSLLYSSNDVVGMVGGSWAYLQHFLPSAQRLGVDPGDVIGIELRVVGAGTHTIAGKQNLWMPDNTLIRPKRLASVRNAGTGAAPSTIADGSVTYSGNQPWFGFGIASGDIHAPIYLPRTTSITAAGAYVYPIPFWANVIDVIAVGGGGGGQGGSGAAISGDGGSPGAWTTKSLIRGTHFPTAATQFTGVVGVGGDGGGSLVLGGDGSPGKATTVVYTTTTLVTAAGGGGGTGYVNPDGAGPGNMSFKGTTYFGGSLAAGPVLGGYGNAPGGAGPGGQGILIVGGPGANGANGAVWFVANQ